MSIDAYSVVSLGPGEPSFRIELEPLEVAEIVARRYGFKDVDVEPMVDWFTITAKGDNGTVTAKGGDITSAVQNLVRRMTNV